MNTDNYIGNYLNLESTIEKWKVIEKFPIYSVSTLGRVRNNTTGKVLKPRERGKGYMGVWLSSKNKSIHRLVAEAFIPNPENKPTVDHIDRNPKNNNVTNLRWATYDEQLENSIHSKTPILAMKNGNTIQFGSQLECARTLGLDVSTINKCLQGKRKTHKGYSFKYV